MSITTEEAERLARLLDVFPIPAAALRSLAAERDALRAERNAERNARFKAEAEFSHMQRRIARLRRALAKLYKRRHDRNTQRLGFLTGMTAAIRALSDTPSDMVLVPREPTSAMHDAGFAVSVGGLLGNPMDYDFCTANRRIWIAMVEAAEKGETND
jgi:hypothetical protein